MEDFQVIVGGEAGQGAKQAGHLLASALNQYGYKTFVREDYPSLIQGGHNFVQIRASRERKRGLTEDVDFVLAMDEKTFEVHADKVEQHFIYNSNQLDKMGVGVPIETIAEEEGEEVMGNTALFAAFCKIIGIDFKTVEKVVESLPMPEKNFKVAKRAYSSVDQIESVEDEGEPEPILDGNEALALGALEAGLDNYFAYPMTPSTGILHFLADLEQTYDIDVVQPENEIAVINEALGAAYSGKRSMVGTSGGGFALMNESLSLAAISETPVVLVESQRAAPASGVPTYNGQSDLNFALGAGHGDFLRLVFTPGDPEEAFWLTNLAMNMSWKYQLPSVMLVDKEISEGKVSFDDAVLEKAEKWEAVTAEDSEEYSRYQDTESGISPLSFPGGEAIVRNNSYEHDEYGTTTEDAELVDKMQEKRARKEEAAIEELLDKKLVKTFGEGDKVVVTWGSSKMAAKEAALEAGYKLVQILCFSPFPEKQFKEALGDPEEVIVVEQNRLGQAAEIVSQYVEVDEKLLKYNGRPFQVEKLINKINNV